jgi:hypothetical protein
MVLMSRLQSDRVVNLDQAFKSSRHHAKTITCKVFLALSGADRVQGSPDGALVVALHSLFSNSSNSTPLLSGHPNAVPDAEYSVASFYLSLFFFVVWLVWCDEGDTRIIREAAAALSLACLFFQLFFRPFFISLFDFFVALTWVVYGDSFMEIIREHVTFDFGQERLRCFSSTSTTQA